MKGWLERIGGGGLAALAALAIAAGAIGYRLLDTGEDGQDVSAPADPLSQLERRAEADPDNAAAWQELGFAYFERGRFAEAATAYERATAAAARQPRTPVAVVVRGHVRPTAPPTATAPTAPASSTRACSASRR